MKTFRHPTRFEDWTVAIEICFFKVNFGDFEKLMRGGETRAVAQVIQLILSFENNISIVNSLINVMQ